ncbi:MAG TPA: hypothetical protein VIK91_13920 [Nannocystis sp.]
MMTGPVSALLVASSLVFAGQPTAQSAPTAPAVPAYAQPIWADPPPGYYDPPPGYYDPPPAFYEGEKPGDPPVYKDPPPGYYDPPPGWYDPPPGYYLPPAGLPSPQPIPTEPRVLADDAFRKWAARRQQLQRRQIAWGVVLGASVFTLGLLVATAPSDCRDCGIWHRPFLGLSAIILGKISLVSSIINGVALARHNRNRPTAHLSFGPGSVRLNF